MCQVFSLVVICFACKVYVNVRLKLYEHKIFWKAGLQPHNIRRRKENLESVTMKETLLNNFSFAFLLKIYC